MSKWLPIETAPRDGSRMKLRIPYAAHLFTEEQCTDEGYWDAGAERRSWGDKQTDPDWRKLRVVERGCFRFDGDDGAFDIQPTHWTPLQDPPVVVEETDT